ncbi:MAG: HNH endonuclease [Alcanivoracaceae bacterium]|nr:HNH endonuclease [Alcanivoracaceae bacterium]
MDETSKYVEAFQSLNVNKVGGISPHKMCMLLAVLDLFDSDPEHPNRIEYSPKLLDRYSVFFNAVKGEGDHPNPYFPFFHMRKEGFWILHPKEGKADSLSSLSTVRSSRQLTDIVAYASLDPSLFRLLKIEESRAVLTKAIVNYWFDRQSEELRLMVDMGKQVNRYEQSLRGLNVEKDLREIPPAYVRDRAFRRVVLEAYDYRCAATATRIILPDESIMVQAAHIEPFSVSGNDDPRNGLALTPDMHWAMDKHVIAPGPDFKWHVSSQVDRRHPENELLSRLHGTDLILPREQRLWPKQEYLEWRKKNLV